MSNVNRLEREVAIRVARTNCRWTQKELAAGRDCEAELCRNRTENGRYFSPCTRRATVLRGDIPFCTQHAKMVDREMKRLTRKPEENPYVAQT